MKKYYISTKIETVKHLQAVFCKQGNSVNDIMMSNQILENHGLFWRHYS